jgi:hypothetical protein
VGGELAVHLAVDGLGEDVRAVVVAGCHLADDGAEGALVPDLDVVRAGADLGDGDLTRDVVLRPVVAVLAAVRAVEQADGDRPTVQRVGVRR